jgi:methionine synthase II (cobalamin-independent)
MNPNVKATVVGSDPVPSWLVGNTSRLLLRDAVMAVLKTQELAGLDLVTDGELMRFDPSHPESNGMVDYFLDAAKEAGLKADPQLQATFPPSELATVSINFFTTVGDAVDAGL